MIEHLEMLISKLRFVFVGVLMIASVLLLLQIFSAARTVGRDSTVHAEGSSAATSVHNPKSFGNPNVVAVGMSNMADTFAKSMNTTERTLVSTFGSVFRSVASVSRSAANAAAGGTRFVAAGIYRGVAFAARGVGNGIVFVAQLPVKAMGLITEAPGVKTLIRPDDTTSMPMIDSQLLALYPEQPETAKQEPVPVVQPQIDTSAIWPIHGRITTKFGVPHWPYQKTHTGLDISSGNRSGVTGVKPFRSGQVMKVVYSRVGLGNHVVVDHGGGLTSVYAHLYSISVKEKQPVDTSTVLGLEGSTGASTGTHLHFEIRQDGQVVDPRQYVSGQP